MSKIIIVDDDPVRSAGFERLRSRVRCVVDDRAVSIEQVGGGSVAETEA